MKYKENFPNDFFSKTRKVVNIKETLNDVVPVDWNSALKNRKNNDKQIVKLVKKND